ncbi:GL14509 [Drosophila persimilis]|uniref:GL14509 n=1 Tax=Drosophila persimilis TaxID=7234 RepID=B4IRK3_DROPE|nr:GL14509 [Drosophila persimilis]
MVEGPRDRHGAFGLKSYWNRFIGAFLDARGLLRDPKMVNRHSIAYYSRDQMKSVVECKSTLESMFFIVFKMVFFSLHADEVDVLIDIMGDSHHAEVKGPALKPVERSNGLTSC